MKVYIRALKHMFNIAGGEFRDEAGERG